MCAARSEHSDDPRSPIRHVKQNWEKLYRVAVLESDPRKVLERIENAEAAIMERSRSLSLSPDSNEKEQDAITQALRILRLLRQAEREP